MILQILTYCELGIPDFRDFYTHEEFIFGFFIEDPEIIQGEEEKLIGLLVGGQWVSVKQEPELEKFLIERFTI